MLSLRWLRHPRHDPRSNLSGGGAWERSRHRSGDTFREFFRRLVDAHVVELLPVAGQSDDASRLPSRFDEDDLPRINVALAVGCLNL